MSATAAVGLAPGHEWGWRLRAVALQRLDRPVEAVEAARESVRAAPGLSEPHVVLAGCLLDTYEAPEAWEEARTACALDPHRARAHATMGRVALEMDRLDVAETALREALRLEPENAVALHNLGVVLLRRGRRDEGIEYVSHALRLDPHNRELRASAQRLHDSGRFRDQPGWRQALQVALFLAGQWLPLLIGAIVRRVRRARVRRQLRRHLGGAAMRELGRRSQWWRRG